MNALPDRRLDELFVRYWDNALSQAEANELETILANDPGARGWFQMLVAQAVVAAELPSVPGSASAVEPAATLPKSPHGSRRWSRRRVLGFIGGTVAASLGAGFLGYSWWPSAPEPAQDKQVRIRESTGATVIRTAEGRTLPAEGVVPPGATVATQGFGSIVILELEDGSIVQLLSDSTISIRENGQLLQLHRGTASAELLPRRNEDRITLATNLLTLSGVHNTAITVGAGAKSAELAVYQGAVSVSAPTGEPMAFVREGEMLTVGENGVRSQQHAPTTPDHFAWDLTTSLPMGWHIGRREILHDGTPVMRCEEYADPYHKGTVMQQIRSDNRWNRGMFSLTPGSTIYVRYRAKLDSPKGQVCFCVRTAQARCSDTGVLEYNRGFKACPDGKWRELVFTAESMNLPPNKHAPKFAPPWVGFLVILNTFEPDVGLEVAEFRIDSPG